MTLTGPTIWLSVGILGQALFGARFLVQWIYSEARGRSLIPSAFWYLSVAGGMTLLSYAIYRKEPVFIAGEAFTLIVFVRNLHMVRRESRAASVKDDEQLTVAGHDAD